MNGEWPTVPADRHSYDPDNVGHTFDEEIARLRTQVELSWTVEQRRLAGFGVADGQRVLEPGCGPGFVTLRLASWLRQSRIVSFDPDRRMLNIARHAVQARGVQDRTLLLQSSVADIGLLSNSFDVALSRYLFQHLRDPVRAATDIRRLLRPGGIHIIIDIDDGLWGLVEPKFGEFETWHRRLAVLQSARGGNRFRGRRLGRILREAGYTSVQLDLFAYHSDDLGIDAFTRQLDPSHFLPLVDEGRMTFVDYLKAQALYRQFLQSSEAFLLSVGFIACGENPQ
jgi:ubiquinone/menaquinone biosynthesis C-methylase UbiE